jgi:CubicO group peptidase (beta-lactamase class C family)
MSGTTHRAARGFAAVRHAILAGRIPGAVLGVLDLASGERAVLHDGLAQREPDTVAMRRETIFDLASLTKPVFTATRILQAVEAGLIGLDDRLTRAIPDLRQYDVEGALERRLTFRQCLAHQSFLPAVWPFYTYGNDPATLRAFLLQRAWKAGQAVYSDINYLYLGIALERLHGKPLGDIDPGPGLSFHPDPALCAATERCAWRGRVLRGEVHDENAFAFGGAAGHAGLFGGADALLDFVADLAAGRLLSPESLAEIRRRQGGHRTIGWEAAHSGWLGGETCSPDSIGHCGFTGTGLWIDWQRGLAWTLLTNRVHPSRFAESFIASLRRAVGEAVCG